MEERDFAFRLSFGPDQAKAQVHYRRNYGRYPEGPRLAGRFSSGVRQPRRNLVFTRRLDAQAAERDGAFPGVARPDVKPWRRRGLLLERVLEQRVSGEDLLELDPPDAEDRLRAADGGLVEVDRGGGPIDDAEPEADLLLRRVRLLFGN